MELLEGGASGASDLEGALLELCRKSCKTPALLEPADLDRLRAVVGDGALDYVLVLSAFHFINRIADLLAVDPQALPNGLRRFEWLRRASVSIASRIMRRMDLGCRPYGANFDEALERFGGAFAGSGEEPSAALAPLAARPKLIEALALAVEERRRSTVDPRDLERVYHGVEVALPSSQEEADGFHPRPADPLDALIFVGTRYPARTTDAMVEALREGGRDDLEILDLTVAIADTNQWARLYRLLGLPHELYYRRAEALRGDAPADAS